MSTEQEVLTDVLQPLPVLIASAFLQILRLSWRRIKSPPASRISPACQPSKWLRGRQVPTGGTASLKACD